MTPIITEEQKQLLQQTTLYNGTNVWEYVQSVKSESQLWVAKGILECIKNGWGLTLLEINCLAINYEYKKIWRSNDLPVFIFAVH